MATPEPRMSNDTRDTTGFYWVLMRVYYQTAPQFAIFRTASKLLTWYEDASVSEGEEGRVFSRSIIAWSHSQDELQILAEAESEVFS